jgi:nitric oxide reductase subunit B
VVPLVLIGFGAWDNLRLMRVRDQVSGYRWAIDFFVAFWNMLGVGLCSVRGLMSGRPWRTGALAVSFWVVNLGLLLMTTVSLLPVGLMQRGVSP